MILPGTIPETPISREWSQQLERPLGVVPTGKNAWLAATGDWKKCSWSCECSLVGRGGDSCPWHFFLFCREWPVTNSAIHKGAGRAIPGFAWYNSWKTLKPWIVERSLTSFLPLAGGFVNSAIRVTALFTKPPASQFLAISWFDWYYSIVTARFTKLPAS